MKYTTALAAAPAGTPPPTEPPQFQPMRLDLWCAAVDREPEPLWLVPGFIPSDSAVLISGSAKVSHKTWLAEVLCWVVASGLPVGLFECQTPGPVLWIEEEGPRKQMRNRVKFLAKGSGLDVEGLPIFFAHRQGVMIDDPARTEQICAFVRAHRVKLVILDTWAKVKLGDENSVQDMTRAMQALDRIRHANPGCSVLFIHHLRKEGRDGSVDIDDEIRGSSAMAGFYDTHLAIRKRRKNQPYLELTVRSSDAEEAYYHVQWDISSKDETATFEVMRVDGEDVQDDFMTECASKLIPGHAYTERQLRDAWPGVARDQVLRTAYAMVQSGHLQHNEEGRVWILGK